MFFVNHFSRGGGRGGGGGVQDVTFGKLRCVDQVWHSYWLLKWKGLKLNPLARRDENVKKKKKKKRKPSIEVIDLSHYSVKLMSGCQAASASLNIAAAQAAILFKGQFRYFEHWAPFLVCLGWNKSDYQQNCDCSFCWKKLLKIKITEDLPKVNDESRTPQWACTDERQPRGRKSDIIWWYHQHICHEEV